MLAWDVKAIEYHLHHFHSHQKIIWSLISYGWGHCHSERDHSHHDRNVHHRINVISLNNIIHAVPLDFKGISWSKPYKINPQLNWPTICCLFHCDYFSACFFVWLVCCLLVFYYLFIFHVSVCSCSCNWHLLVFIRSDKPRPGMWQSMKRISSFTHFIYNWNKAESLLSHS